MTATIEAPDGQNGTELAIPDPLSAAKYLLECAPTRFDQETTMFEREEPVYVMVDTAGSSTTEPAEEPAAPAFTDVAENAYYAQPVAWAVTEGITAGKTADTFDPDGICTRGNIVTFLYRAPAE